MARLDIPIKSSKARAKSMIASKMADKTLGVGDRRRLLDQYQEYAKGGNVVKQTKKKVIK